MKWLLKFTFFTTTILLISPSLHAENITLASEQEISVEVYGKDTAKYSVLWMHSERGVRGDLQHTILATSKQSIQVFLPDWLDAYFISPTRSSLENIPQQDYEDLITHYIKQTASKSKPQVNKLFIVATGRSASLVLNAVHRLQSNGTKAIGGVILISPYLQKKTPDIGQKLQYQKIASHSNLPIYVMQAESSPRFVPLPHLINELEKGGSSVYTQIFQDVNGGFHMRPKDDMSEKDLAARKQFPKHLLNALKLLATTKTAPLQPLDSYVKTIRKKLPIRLQKISMTPTPDLSLKDLEGKQHNITDYKGKTVLVSYWASWCRPCIEEMPSLVKLKEKYKDQLEILAVNVREDKTTIKKFTQAMNINFPLLQDNDSKTVENWRVYVYPSNYIIDKTGKVQYAATGAMNWQEEGIEKIIEGLNE